MVEKTNVDLNTPNGFLFFSFFLCNACHECPKPESQHSPSLVAPILKPFLVYQVPDAYCLPHL